MRRTFGLLVACTLGVATIVAPASADEGEATYVLAHRGPDVVNLGDVVVEFLTAKDEAGTPLAGLPVRFVRTGPGAETAESCSVQQLAECEKTGLGGEAFHNFGVGFTQGVIQSRAEVYSPEGVLLAVAGPYEITVFFTCEFGAKCSPLPGPWLDGTNKNGRDVLKVKAYAFRAGSAVVLLRKFGGVWSPAGRGQTAGTLGRAIFSVRDDNGQRRTSYRAVVLRKGEFDTVLTRMVRLR